MYSKAIFMCAAASSQTDGRNENRTRHITVKEKIHDKYVAVSAGACDAHMLIILINKIVFGKTYLIQRRASAVHSPAKRCMWPPRIP